MTTEKELLKQGYTKVVKFQGASSPCSKCNEGWSKLSTTTFGGELYTKNEDCVTTCPKFKKWLAEGYKEEK